MLYPLIFHPILKERIWGGRKLHDLYRKSLAGDVPIGESWEIVDRPDDVSVVANGSLEGKDLHSLLEEYGNELMGDAKLLNGRFPLLIKILDARQTLSLQVHPPASLARQLGGEPKTEMWYITEAEPGAKLYVGLKRGTTKAQFEEALRVGKVQDCFHRVPVERGDAMFLPSGRVHALGAGLVLFEIQQNSDTTYRVYDWDRLGADGKPRPLHIDQSLACIDFTDFEPGLVSPQSRGFEQDSSRVLVENELFTVQEFSSGAEPISLCLQGTMRILGVVAGKIVIASPGGEVSLEAGQFCLLPAVVRSELWVEPQSTILNVTAET